MKWLISFLTMMVALPSLLAMPSYADPVKFNYIAEVSSFTGSSVFGISPGAGTEVTGFFVYESSTADANAADPTRGNYEHTFTLNDGSETLILQFTSVTPVPEPALLGFSMLGAAVIGLRRRRR